MANKLYCPRCAGQFTDGTSYCRSCGLSLDAVTKIVTGEAASALEIQTRPNFKLFRLGIGLFILGLVIALINGALRDFGLYPDAYGKMLFMVIVAAGMLLLGAGFVFPTKRYAQLKGKGPTSMAAEEVKLDTSPLSLAAPAGEMFVPKRKGQGAQATPISRGSVTENTTRNLE